MPGTELVAGLVPAAGRGERLGGGVPKALREVGGRPLLTWAVDALLPICDVVVVAAPPELLAAVRAAVPSALVVAGGAERSDSVRACLAALPPEVRYVLVHDAARPLAPTALAAAVLAALRAGADAVVPVLPVSDTIKSVDSDGWVTATPDRAALRIVQTPQGFTRDVLVRAHASGADATDDAGLVERIGTRVRTIPGDLAAAKVTVPADLVTLGVALEQVRRG
jgi:2-C-methyl-D-erythritol 4-phosphate cytidylyltransferase